ncbi:MAG TPA: hypothetical protein PKO06_00370 [Candidatus Ozemobacteraceae bacterium]|mgnify:CR=1 FL=1|nr:hypothetical protein [Candidatus Ozemobacteraceae bacterium]
MLVFQRSEAGTIREQNQDLLLAREEHGIFILADGEGANGRAAAEQAAERLASDLLRLKALSSPAYAADAFPRLIEQTARSLQQSRIQQPEMANTSVSLGICFIHEARLFVATTGRVGALIHLGSDVHTLEPHGIPPLAATLADDRLNGTTSHHPTRACNPDPTYSTSSSVSEESFTISQLGPLSFQVGDWVLFCSQGLLISQPLAEIVPIAPAVHEDAENLANALFQRASARYDGDDRSLALLRFLPADLQLRFPPERVLSVDLDKRWKAPLWIPLALLGICTCLGVWLKKRLSVFLSED